MKIMVLDVEATGTCDKAKVYDLGALVLDTRTGEVLDRANLVIEDIFYNSDLMRNAYYADKVPAYYEDIRKGLREVQTFATARAIVLTLCRQYKVRSIWAYNAIYDMNALNYTSNMLIGRDFIPENMNLTFKCIMGAFMSTLGMTKKYAKRADRTEKGNIRCSAEAAYRYITGMSDFEEEHTGLADAEIEAEILLACLKRHAKMDTEPKSLFSFPCYKKIQEMK